MKRYATWAEPINWTPPTRDEEAANIEFAAEHYRDKTGADDEPSEYDKWNHAIRRLAALQRRYDEIEIPPYDFENLDTYLFPKAAFPLWKEAYKILKPLMGRVGAVAVLHNVRHPFSHHHISIKTPGPKSGRPEFLNATDSKIKAGRRQARVGVAIMLLRKRGLGLKEAKTAISGKMMDKFLPKEFFDFDEHRAAFNA